VAEEEAVTVVGIRFTVVGGSGGEREGFGSGVVEEVGGVEAEGRFDVEGRAAQTHHAEHQRMRSSSSLTTNLNHLFFFFFFLFT